MLVAARIRVAMIPFKGAFEITYDYGLIGNVCAAGGKEV